MRHASNAKARQELPQVFSPQLSVINVNGHFGQHAWTHYSSTAEAGSDRYDKYSPYWRQVAPICKEAEAQRQSVQWPVHFLASQTGWLQVKNRLKPAEEPLRDGSLGEDDPGHFRSQTVKH
jgi:hypothetical protein